MLLKEIAKKKCLLPQYTEFGIVLIDDREYFVMVWSTLTNDARKDLLLNASKRTPVYQCGVQGNDG